MKCKVCKRNISIGEIVWVIVETEVIADNSEQGFLLKPNNIVKYKAHRSCYLDNLKYFMKEK